MSKYYSVLFVLRPFIKSTLRFITDLIFATVIRVNKIYFKFNRNEKILILILFLSFLIFWNILPARLFKDPVCTVIEDKDGHLLGAHIAKDGQWRFPLNQVVTDKFKTAIIAYEDKRYYYHWGVDFISIYRALLQNISSGKIVSGGSTLTMQLVRLSRKGKSRSILEKIIESILAIRLELEYSKSCILALYASNAPFGGNVVGLDAASWRYFKREANDLSWAEAAMLAVLPNNPALVHISKNRPQLLKKRNALLNVLYKKRIIDLETYKLSIEEPIPDEPKPFPQNAPHLTARIGNEKNPITKIKTTIDATLQEKIEQIVNHHYLQLSGNQINNIAVLVVEVETGQVLSYIGNVSLYANNKNANQVDIITSERSTGSILKPFLYAAMLSSGEILPDALIPDIPTQIGGFVPQNYNLGYDGAVKAKRALSKSLNVPAVKLLQKYGVERFHYLLTKIGMTSLHNPPDYYGLSLILGGCEGKLWDLVGIYASMARTLNHYTKYNGKYNKEDFFMPIYQKNESGKSQIELSESGWLSASAIWLTFQALLDVERPEEESNWQDFSSSQKIAWKTGTSFGFRDAWAIGVTPKYVTGVWVGNADGEGRPQLVGVKAAAPVLFEIIELLPSTANWFEQPYDDMIKTAICHKSGYLASEACEEIDSAWIPHNGIRFPVCPYHQIIHLDQSGKWRVTSDCESTDKMHNVSWFVLPPAMEWFYKSKNPNYTSLPPFREDCLKSLNISTANQMEIIYPHNFSKLYLPVDLDGHSASTVFEAAHRKPNTTIFWHIDDIFVGQTKGFHKISINPLKGSHILTLNDEFGEKITLTFEILEKNKKK